MAEPTILIGPLGSLNGVSLGEVRKLQVSGSETHIATPKGNLHVSIPMHALSDPSGMTRFLAMAKRDHKSAQKLTRVLGYTTMNGAKP